MKKIIVLSLLIMAGGHLKAQTTNNNSSGQIKVKTIKPPRPEGVEIKPEGSPNQPVKIIKSEAPTPPVKSTKETEQGTKNKAAKKD